MAALRVAWLLHFAGKLAPQGGAPAAAASAASEPSSFLAFAALAHSANADALLALSLLFPVRQQPAHRLTEQPSVPHTARRTCHSAPHNSKDGRLRGSHAACPAFHHWQAAVHTADGATGPHNPNPKLVAG